MTALVPAPSSTAPRHRAFGGEVSRRPRLRSTVRRPRLLGTLCAAGAPPFAILVAPAGYGKTTLLCEWCAHDPRPFAWVTLDHRHDDSGCLLRSIARAVDEATANAPDGRVVLVFDDVHALASEEALATLSLLATRPPDGVTIVFASRTEPPLP